MFSPSTSTSSTSYGGINVSFIRIRSYTILQQRQVPSSRLAVFAFLITALFDFLQLEYQGKDSASPFQTHPKIMWVAVSSLILYCFACEVEPRSSRVGRGGMGFFGSILSVSLASLLFENRVSLVLYFLCVLFSNGEMLSSGIEVLRRWLHQRTVADVLRSISRQWFTVPASANEGGLLPVWVIEVLRRWLHRPTIVDLSRSINRRWFTVPASANQGGLLPVWNPGGRTTRLQLEATE